MRNRFLFIASLAAGLAVILGAFGAHSLKTVLSPDRMTVWQTAVTYQMWHALGLGLISRLDPQSQIRRWSGWFMSGGMGLFCGSLYLLCLTDLRWLGMITPVGGISFIIAWVLLAVYGWRKT